MSHLVIQDPNSISGKFSNRHSFNNIEEDLDNMISKNLAPTDEQDLENNLNQANYDFSKVDRHLARIPAREADFIRLYHRDRMKQEQIARLFSITQAAVSYRLHRGIKRIQFLQTIPELEFESFTKDLGPKFNAQDMEIMWRMYETTCQSEIAKKMGLTQGRVRHRFFRALNTIKELIKQEVNDKFIQLQTLIRHGVSKDGLSDTEEELKKAMEELSAADSNLKNAIRTSKYGKYWTVFYAISDKHFNILHEVSLPQFVDRGDAQILSID